MTDTRGNAGPQPRRSIQTPLPPHLYCGTRPWQRVTLLNDISLLLRGLILSKPTSSRIRHHFSGQTQLAAPLSSPLLSPPATRSRRQGRFHLTFRDICDGTYPCYRTTSTWEGSFTNGHIDLTCRITGLPLAAQTIPFFGKWPRENCIAPTQSHKKQFSY